jgi:hypothetical protein
MTNRIIVVARIAKDTITYHLIKHGLMGVHYKEVIIAHVSRLPHSHTFFFSPIPLDRHDFCRMGRFIPPTHKTMTSAAPQLCPGRADSEEFNCL